MSKRPNWAGYEPTPTEMENALARLIEEGDFFLEWVSCEALADDVREPSRYFPEAGGISTVEMFRRASAGESTAEQCRDVFRELVERFKDARLELIEEAAKREAISKYQSAEEASAEERYLNRQGGMAW